MPWHAAQSDQCPASKPWAVIKDATGEVEGCHASRDDALQQVAALYANEPPMVGSRGAAMNDGMHYRTYRPDLEVRSGGDGRTIYGIAVPYNAPTRIDSSLVEQFSPGAFNHQFRAPGRVKYARDHMRLGGTLIGNLTAMRDDAVGLYVEMRVSRTAVGDETLELVRDGALSQLSIMFGERQNRMLPGNIMDRVKADLYEVASVLEGAYGDLAATAGVRAAVADGGAPVGDAALLHAAEQYLVPSGLPDLPDHEVEIQAIRLGLRF